MKWFYSFFAWWGLVILITYVWPYTFADWGDFSTAISLSSLSPSISICILIAFIFLTVLGFSAPWNAWVVPVGSFVGLVIWYVVEKEPQVKYVKERLCNRYPRKHFARPIGIATACVAVVVWGLLCTPLGEGKKLTAFRALVAEYQREPHGNVSLRELAEHRHRVEELQTTFIQIPFNFKENPRDAKRIAELYLDAIEGNYNGEVAFKLRSHIEPIWDAYRDDVKIPERIRQSLGH